MTPDAAATRNHSRPHLRLERIRLGALVLGVCLWTVYAWVNATPNRFDRTGAVKGWDFPQFYVNGLLVADGRLAALYDPASVTAVTASTVSAEVDYVHNVYAPHIALVFAPLSRLPYGWALAVWLAASTVLYAWSGHRLRSMLRSGSPDTPTLALLLSAAPAWWLTVQYGQLSALLLAVVVAAWSQYARERPIVSGVVLGLLWAKPQLLLPMVAVLALAGERRMVAGVAVSGLAQLLVTAALMGTQPLLDYGRVVLSLGSLAPTLQSKSHLLQSFSGFFGLLFPASPSMAWGLALACSAAAVATGARAWRERTAAVSATPPRAPMAHSRPFELSMRRWIALVCVAVLASPHLYVYDLLLLTPVVLTLAWPSIHEVGSRETTATTTLRVVLGAVLFVIPLLSPVVARATSIQPTTVLVAVLLYLTATRRL